MPAVVTLSCSHFGAAAGGAGEEPCQRPLPPILPNALFLIVAALTRDLLDKSSVGGFCPAADGFELMVPPLGDQWEPRTQGGVQAILTNLTDTGVIGWSPAPRQFGRTQL